MTKIKKCYIYEIIEIMQWKPIFTYHNTFISNAIYHTDIIITEKYNCFKKKLRYVINYIYIYTYILRWKTVDNTWLTGSSCEIDKIYGL